MNATFTRLKSLPAATGMAISTVYKRMHQGLWPKPVSLGGRAVGWLTAEIESINKARIAGANDEQIRELVAQLEADRSLTL